MNHVLDLIDREALYLAKLHNKPAAYFLEQLYQGGKYACKKRELNIWNAAKHCIGLIENEKESESGSFSGIGGKLMMYRP